MASTLGTLVSNVRIILQETTAQYFSTAEIKKSIGDAFRFYTTVLADQGNGSFETVDNVGFTSGTETIDLDSALTYEFINIVSVERNRTDGSYPLYPKKRRYNPNITTSTGVGDSYFPDIDKRSRSLVLSPPPASTESGSSTTGLKVHYTYTPTFPNSSSADGFTFDTNLKSIFEPMVELRAAKICMRDKSGAGALFDNSSFASDLAEWEARFSDGLDDIETPDRVEYVGFEY